MPDPYVITRLCRDCVDGACVDACPIECIYQHDGAHRTLPNQLFINPEECIHCAACEPACPWEAIFSEDEVPAAFVEDIALNALTASHKDEFSVPELALRTRAKNPSPEAVAQNKERWIPARSA